jgi:mono/diheme cytochrome c family protein
MEPHQKWLPNAGLHLEVVSCAACHAPAAQRMVDLRLYDGSAKKWVSEKQGRPQFENMARATNADGNGVDAMELRIG